MRTILVTAFEPFAGEAINASWEAARRLDGWRCGEAVVAARMLPCAYEVCVDEFVSEFGRLSPCAVLLTGQAARRGMVSIERFGRNEASATARDNRNTLGPVATTGPDVLKATAPPADVARAIRESGVNARISNDAGDYVCNHLYYGALRHLASASPRTAAVFVHLPATPEQSPAAASGRRLTTIDAALALQAAVQVLARDDSSGAAVASWGSSNRVRRSRK